MYRKQFFFFFFNVINKNAALGYALILDLVAVNCMSFLNLIKIAIISSIILWCEN